jgi:MYXO-CTERM domain-containing protein
VTIENMWSWYNGYLPETTTACANCNGNGFKGGGYNIPPTDVPAQPPSHILQNCLAFMNTAAGFYANHEPVGDRFYNDTSYNNGDDFNLLGIRYTSSMDGGYPAQNVGILRNNIAFMGTLLENATGGTIDDQYNSWDPSLGVTVTAADFQSTSIVGMDGPRQADGSLPCVPFLRLAAGSDLIGKGINLSTDGGAPVDLGAFPFGPCVEADAGSDAATADSGQDASGNVGDAAPGSSGDGGAGSSDGGGGTTDAGSGVPPGSEAGSGADAGGNSSGCGCATVGDGANRGGSLALVGLVGIAFVARRRRDAARRREHA